MVGKLLSEIVRGDLLPPQGNTGVERTQSGGNCAGSGGLAYTVGGVLSNGVEADDVGGDSLHESQTSHLASQAGGILLDYLRCRFRDSPETWDILREYLGVLTEREGRWHRYDRSWAVLEGGLVASHSDPEKAAREGVIVDLPGRACGSLGEDLPLFFCLCTERAEKITRADYAIDDRAGLLTREGIEAASAAGGMITRWQGGILETSRKLKGKVQDWTMYFGDRAGDSMVRIYDKAAEQGVAGPWVRLEFETKHDLADALSRAYFEQGGEAIIGEINRHLRFALPVATDSNKRRWPTLTWWAEFIGSVKPGASLLPGVLPDLTIGRMERWLLNQVSPTLSVVLEHDGNYDLILELEKNGRGRWKSKHLAALEAAKLPARWGDGEPPGWLPSVPA